MAGGEEGLEGEPEFECEEEEAEPHVVLFTFFMLLVGLLTLQFLRKVPVPYTAQLLVSFGIAWYWTPAWNPARAVFFHGESVSSESVWSMCSGGDCDRSLQSVELCFPGAAGSRKVAGGGGSKSWAR